MLLSLSLFLHKEVNSHLKKSFWHFLTIIDTKHLRLLTLVDSLLKYIWIDWIEQNIWINATALLDWYLNFKVIAYSWSIIVVLFRERLCVLILRTNSKAHEERLAILL